MPSMRAIPAQYTTDSDLLPSPATLRTLAQASGPASERYSKIAAAGLRDNGEDPDTSVAATLLAEIAGRKASMEGEQAALKSLFQRLDRLYYPADVLDPGGADHWPDGRKPGRAHVSVNAYQVYVDIPASLQSVVPIENIVGESSEDDEREAAARVERLYFGWKDADDFELKTHQACVVKGLYGHTFGKVMWDAVEERPTVVIIDQPEQLYVGWGSSNYDRMDWALYCYGLSDQAIEETYGLKVGVYSDGAGRHFPYVVGQHADPLHLLSTSPSYRKGPNADEMVEVYDYWYKKPTKKGKRAEVWNAIFVGNYMVENARHREYDDLPYVPLPNTYVPGSPYGRPELYDLEQMFREKDERISAAAQMIETITNGQMWQLVGSEASDEVPPNAVPKANSVAAPGPNAKLEALQPFVPQFAVEDYLKRIDAEIETISGLNEVLLGRAPQGILGSSKAMNGLVALYEARIAMKRQLLYRWRKRVWEMAARVWESKSAEVKRIIDGRYRIDVKAPELTPRDELEVAQMALNLVNGRIWTMERAMDRTGVEDPSDEKMLIRSEQTDPTLNPAAVQAQTTLLAAMASLQQAGVQAPSPEQSSNASRQANRRPRGTSSLNGPENEGQAPPESLPANAGSMTAQTMVQGGQATGRILSQVPVTGGEG